MNASRETVRQCAAYFRENPAFARIMKELRRKCERYGSPAGTVVIKDASAAECEAARGIFGTPFSAPLKFKATQFEDALQMTKFQGVSLKEVMELYFGAEIKTKRERDAEAETRYCRILRETRTDGETSRRWLEALERTNCGASQTLKRALCENEAAARLALQRACQSLDWLERHDGETVRLAVLASDAVSAPHALDRGTLCGNLFLQLLRFRRGDASFSKAEAGSAEQSDALYYENSVSSAVTQVGLILEEADTGAEHPAFAAFRMRREVCTLTLANLRKLSSARSPSGRAYVMENEMAFAQLCDDAARFHSPLICGSGQPTTAVLRLLDMLSVSGTELFYSGDFYGNGMAAEDLVSCGCRRIVCLRGVMRFTSSQARCDGYRRVCEKYAMEERFIEAGFEYEDGIAAAERLLQCFPDTDGIIASNDLVALAVYKVLTRAGRRVPDEIQLVGFDDVRFSRLMTPELTTVRQPISEMGHLAVRLLLDFEKGASVSKEHIFDVSLVERETTRKGA